MKSPMVPADHQAAVRRVLALGRSGNPTVLPELVAMLALPSNEVQRLAASAMGKLAEFGVDAEAAVAALAPLALKARHPQTQQYAIRALRKYGATAHAYAVDLRDLARNPAQLDYVRAAAATVADAIEQAAADATAGVKHRCQRCGAAVTTEEHARSQMAFQRVFCDRCFDEVFLERRNFEMQVELNKTIEARDGTVVQSEGERRIADWLTAHGVAYRYDAKFRIIAEFQIRPDFYLSELDVYIEYWGLDTPQYKMSMYKKQALYQQEGKRLISVYRADLPRLGALLSDKLRLLGYAVGLDACRESGEEGVGEMKEPAEAGLSTPALPGCPPARCRIADPMQGKKNFSAMVVLLLSVLLSACGTFRQDSDLTQRMRVEDLRRHGKVGRTCARGAYYAGLPLDLVCLPVTYPLYLLSPARTGKVSVIFYPGHALQAGAYALGAGGSYPAYWLLDAQAGRRASAQEGQADYVIRLWRQWPYIAPEEYPLLIRDAGRSNAPAYAADRPFGGPLRFGRRPKLAIAVREDWEDWTVRAAPATRPTDRKRDAVVDTTGAPDTTRLPAMTNIGPSGIEGLLRELGDVRYATRESAQQQLLGLAQTHAQAVLEAIRPRLGNVEDPEVRTRLLTILDQVFEVLVLRRPRGYLGISMQMTQQAGFDGKPVHAVQVMSVIRDSAAMLAGLQPGDRIVRLDEFEVTQESTLPAFAKFIQSHLPGSVAVILVRRQEETLKREAKLGLIPEEMKSMVIGSDESREARFREWLQKQIDSPGAGGEK